MIKSVQPATNLGSTYSKSKCAEIHYHSSTFSILCILCGMKTLAFSEFCNHFYNHYESFINALADKEELFINSENEIGKRDPLKLEVGDVVKEDSEEVLNILRSGNVEATKLTIVSEVSNNHEYQMVSDSEESGKEFANSGIKLEQNNISQKHLNDCRNNSESDESSMEISSAIMESLSLDHLNSGVDWSKSYEPNLLRNSDKRPYKARNTPNMCTYCGKTFRRRLQLDTHLNIHTGSKPHQCEFCGRQFRAVTTLARHLNTHETREVFNCKFCTKSFSRRAAMLSHELRHTQQRRIPCDECDKLFYTVNQMDTHKRKVHNKADDSSLQFKCNLCTKRYRSASMLSTHKYKKHYKTAKIVCEQCGKKFVNDQQLEAHKAIHIFSIKNYE